MHVFTACSRSADLDRPKVGSVIMNLIGQIITLEFVCMTYSDGF